ASTFDSHPAHDGIKMSPIRFDPGRFRDVTIRRDPHPVSLPVARSPVEVVHHAPLSHHFSDTERSMPVVPSVPSSWHEYYDVPRGGGALTPSLPHAPWSALPSHPVAPAPVEHAPIERAPSPVLRSGGNSGGGSHAGGGGQSSGGNGSNGGTGGSRPPS
ncbi:MAG TPA: hypothetical protein VKB39_09935, partial [Candidatus Baltobacteraceae bacterium]|nr:hypothetical protein [Candidatus Baltobacteraceae bacterium]